MWSGRFWTKRYWAGRFWPPVESDGDVVLFPDDMGETAVRQESVSRHVVAQVGAVRHAVTMAAYAHVVREE